MANYVDEIDNLDGSQPNTPGLTSNVYYAPKSTFLSIKKPVGPFTDFGDEIEITTAHTFTTGNNWKKLVATLDTGEGGSEAAGDRDSRILQTKWTFRVPGYTKEMFEFQHRAMSDRYIFLFELPDGTVIQVGTERLYAEAKVKDMTGKNGGGYRGIEVEVTSFAEQNYIYTGAITLTPAS